MPASSQRRSITTAKSSRTGTPDRGPQIYACSCIASDDTARAPLSRTPSDINPQLAGQPGQHRRQLSASHARVPATRRARTFKTRCHRRRRSQLHQLPGLQTSSSSSIASAAPASETRRGVKLSDALSFRVGIDAIVASLTDVRGGDSPERRPRSKVPYRHHPGHHRPSAWRISDDAFEPRVRGTSWKLEWHALRLDSPLVPRGPPRLLRSEVNQWSGRPTHCGPGTRSWTSSSFKGGVGVVYQPASSGQQVLRALRQS